MLGTRQICALCWPIQYYLSTIHNQHDQRVWSHSHRIHRIEPNVLKLRDYVSCRKSTTTQTKIDLQLVCELWSVDYVRFSVGTRSRIWFFTFQFLRKHSLMQSIAV